MSARKIPDSFRRLREKVTGLLRQDMDPALIAERLGCPESYVRQVRSSGNRASRPRNGGLWSDEQTTLLERLWKEGLTASQIGDRIGVSRCAVLGKVHRLGLRGRVFPSRDGDRQVFRKEPKPRKPSLPSTTGFKRAVPPSEPYVEIPTNEIPTRTILTVESGECRFPIGDPRMPGFGLCGHEAIPGGPYCLGHARRAYLLPEVAEKSIEVATKFGGAKTGVLLEKEDA